MQDAGDFRFRGRPKGLVGGAVGGELSAGTPWIRQRKTEFRYFVSGEVAKVSANELADM